jgi:hypothetical protein
MPFFTSVILMWVVLYFIYPNYQYYIDPDGTAYLTISRRYAEGYYVQAINGYWSPWSCWLTALLIKQGFAAIPASVIINATGATGFLYITQSFFIRFGVIKHLQWLLTCALAVFLCCAVFYQSFDDLWECFFLLASLRVMLANGFTSRPSLWLVNGVIGALAYFAKAYAFPFFILNTVCCSFLLSSNKKQWIYVSVTSVVAMLMVSAPWIYALHYKYGIWTTSTAGPLNTSWYLVGHPYWREGIAQLLPPAYPDSPYYWEDPYAVNGATPHFWSSWRLAGLQVLRLGMNVVKLHISMLQLSVFFPVIALVVVFSLKQRDELRSYPKDIKVAALSFLLFPLGYLLVNFESRYIWYMLPLGLVIADFIIRRAHGYIAKKVRVSIVYLVLAISLVIYPVLQMVKMNHEGYNDHLTAEQLIGSNIYGSFVSNAQTGKEVQGIVRVAYFSGNPCYTIPYPKEITHEQLLKEIRRYNIPYYYHICRTHGDRDFRFTDEHGRALPEVELGKTSGLRVFQTDTLLRRGLVYKR